MFLLFLIGLGTAHVNAQVRIGGNAAPQGAAVLDLNADNTATPTANKGALALPRVRLDSTTTKLNGTTPITGMLVWNTNATLGVGIYYWSGSAWVKTSLPNTVASDSGKFLMSDGKQIILATRMAIRYVNDSIRLRALPDTIKSWVRILDTSVTLNTGTGGYAIYPTIGLPAEAMCKTWNIGIHVQALGGNITAWNWLFNSVTGGSIRIICYRPVF